MIKLFVIAAVLVNEITTRRQFTGAIACLMLGVVLQAGVALAQNIRGAQLGLAFLGEAHQEDVKILGETSLEGGQFVYRAGALLGHPNLFAAYLALFLGVAIALLLTRAPRLLKALSFVALALGTPALVLTLSRAGWIDFVVAFLLAIALGTWHATSRRGHVFSRVGVILAVVVIGAAMSPLIIARIQRADPTSVEYRLKWITTAREMVADNPFFGVGLNSYVFRQLPYGENRTPEAMTRAYGEMWPVVHNNWLIVWSEQGTAGMILWVGLHIVVIVVGLRNLRIRDPALHAIGVGLLAGFVAIAVDGMASFFVRQEAPARMFWIATALILALDHWRRVNEFERAPVAAAPPPGRDALPGLEGAPRQVRWLPARPSPFQ
jgi:O-antigen ligase